MIPYPRTLDPCRSWGDWRDIKNNVAMIREGLSPGVVIEFHCYNKQEAEETKTELTPEENKQVRFFWLEFPPLKESSTNA